MITREILSVHFISLKKNYNKWHDKVLKFLVFILDLTDLTFTLQAGEFLFSGRSLSPRRVRRRYPEPSPSARP